jgi:polyhydroxyalkanoate synthase
MENEMGKDENEMGKDENEVLAYIDKYATVFNALAQEVLTRTNKTAEGAGASTTSMFDPQKLASLLNGDIKVDSNKFMQKQADLWQQASKAMMGQNLAVNAEKSDSEAAVPKAKSEDRRFAHSDWEQNPVFRYIKESYLINSDMLSNTIDAIEFSDEKAAKKAKFFTRQYVNSLAPTNFFLTNPEVCEEVLKTKGENLVKGMQNFLRKESFGSF